MNACDSCMCRKARTIWTRSTRFCGVMVNAEAATSEPRLDDFPELRRLEDPACHQSEAQRLNNHVPLLLLLVSTGSTRASQGNQCISSDSLAGPAHHLHLTSSTSTNRANHVQDVVFPPSIQAPLLTLLPPLHVPEP